MIKGPNNRPPVEQYVSHEGTIRVSGQTNPWKAACCALFFMEQGFAPVDFLVIGGNANQQAAKAMVSFASKVPERFPNTLVSFVPMMFMTQTENNGVKVEKTCMVWRTIIRRIET
jgi:hypothetical protein